MQTDMAISSTERPGNPRHGFWTGRPTASGKGGKFPTNIVSSVSDTLSWDEVTRVILWGELVYAVQKVEARWYGLRTEGCFLICPQEPGTGIQSLNASSFPAAHNQLLRQGTQYWKNESDSAITSKMIA